MSTLTRIPAFLAVAALLAGLGLAAATNFDVQAPAVAQEAKAQAPERKLQIQWQAPTSYVPGSPYRVQVELSAPAGGTVVSGWLLTPAAFAVDEKSLAEREDKGSMALPEGAKVTAEIDLGPYLRAEKDFSLAYAAGLDESKPVAVQLLEPAPSGLNFMDERSVPLADLSKYNVLLQTNRGDMLLEFWPDVAPNHVRNFLDLSYTNFYVGTTFHRVIPDFMIQGGDPTGTGAGNGPRMLPAEFNARKHERGVLSMARAGSPNSASCQFFVMRTTKPHLDGQYSAFGKLVRGYEVLDAIATTPTGQLDRPIEPQKILKALVIKARPR